MSQVGAEFDSALEIERIKQQTQWEARLGRTFTVVEKAIFDGGFFSGCQFGMRDTMRTADRIIGGK